MQMDAATLAAFAGAITALAVVIKELLGHFVFKKTPSATLGLSTEEVTQLKAHLQTLPGLTVEEHKWLDEIRQTCPGFQKDDQESLKHLVKMHSRTDRDGNPVWYIPQTILDNVAMAAKLATKGEEQHQEIVSAVGSATSKLEEFRGERKQFASVLESHERQVQAKREEQHREILNALRNLNSKLEEFRGERKQLASILESHERLIKAITETRG